MRAGKLDRTIAIQRQMTTPDDYGSGLEAWVTVATLRAQVIEAVSDEHIRGRGASTETTIFFRIRYVAGVTLADRVTYDGNAFDIKQTKELGRRRGLELRCERIGP